MHVLLAVYHTHQSEVHCVHYVGILFSFHFFRYCSLVWAFFQNLLLLFFEKCEKHRGEKTDFSLLYPENHHQECLWITSNRLHGWYFKTEGFWAHQLQGMLFNIPFSGFSFYFLFLCFHCFNEYCAPITVYAKYVHFFKKTACYRYN